MINRVTVKFRIDSTWYDIRLVRRTLQPEEIDASVKLAETGHHVILHDTSPAKRSIVLRLTTGLEAKSENLAGYKKKPAELS